MGFFVNRLSADLVLSCDPAYPPQPTISGLCGYRSRGGTDNNRGCDGWNQNCELELNRPTLQTNISKKALLGQALFNRRCASQKSVENLRLHKVPGFAILKRSKKKKGQEEIQTFSALDWLARLSAHIPDKWEQMVRYYGWYANRSRGERKKAQKIPTESVPVQNPEAESDFKKEAPRQWARLIKKVYEVDPLICPNCQGRMRIISFIEDPAIIQRILTHLGLWHMPSRKRAPPPAAEITLDYSVADEPAVYD